MALTNAEIIPIKHFGKTACVALVQLLLLFIILSISTFVNAFERWENTWKLAHYDSQHDIFIDFNSYFPKGDSAKINFILIDRKSEYPISIQFIPNAFEINCKQNEYSFSNNLLKTKFIVASILEEEICDFSESERLALYKKRGVESDDLLEIETFLHPVSPEIHQEVINYELENSSEIPLPRDEFIKKIKIAEEDLIYSDNSRNLYEIKKDFPKSLILKSNPKYCGWKVGWSYFGPDEFMNKNSSRYIRINEFYYKDSMADFWTLNILNERNYVLMREIINCKKRKIKIEDIQDRMGKDLKFSDVPQEYKNWNSPPPNSIQFYLVNEICEYEEITKNDILGKIIEGEKNWPLIIKDEKIEVNFMPKILFE